MSNSFYNQTTLHPLGVVAILVLAVATWLLPRRFALVPILVAACFISPAQRLVIMSLDFNVLRLLVLAGWMRILVLGEVRTFRWKLLDTLLIAWTLASTFVASMRETGTATLVYHLGLNYDAIGMYLLFRVLVRDWRDVEVLIRAVALLSLPVAGVFMIEQLTGRNMFSIFGGVDAVTQMREGRIRCRGAFAHPIYAGCFWAALLPCFAALWRTGPGWRWLSPLAVVACIVIVFTTASSTPLAALAVAFIALATFVLRRWMSYVRWGMVTLIATLHVLMQAPVWHLLARVDLVGGSTGWYRFKLIDGFIKHADQWWLLGTRDYAALWGPTYKAITNQYVLEGVQGGLLALVLFVAVIVVAFRDIGRVLRGPGLGRRRRLLGWALGACLFVHAIDFLAVSYFGQVLMAWYLALAIAGSLAPARARVPRPRVRLAPVDRRPDANASVPAAGCPA